MDTSRPTLLQSLAWDVARESIKASDRVVNFCTAKMDGTAFSFQYTTLDNNLKSYVIYQRWTKELLPYKGCTHIMVDSLGTLNQRTNEKNNVDYLCYSVFGTGKIQTWEKETILL